MQQQIPPICSSIRLMIETKPIFTNSLTYQQGSIHKTHITTACPHTAPELNHKSTLLFEKRLTKDRRKKHVEVTKERRYQQRRRSHRNTYIPYAPGLIFHHSL